MASHAKDIIRGSTYDMSNINIVRYADHLNERILSEFRSLELSLDKLKVKDELEKIKEITAGTFNKISCLVITDILKQKTTEEAIASVSFWSKVALMASDNFRNLQLEWAIVSGFNNVNIQRTFGPPIDFLKADGETNKPGFQNLPTAVQRTLMTLMIDHKDKSFYQQKGFFPPLSPIFGELETSKAKEDEDKYSQLSNHLINLQSFRSELDSMQLLLDDIHLSLPGQQKRVESISDLDSDEVWELSTTVRDRFRKLNSSARTKVGQTQSDSSFFSRPKGFASTRLTIQREYGSHRETSSSEFIESKSTLNKTLRNQAIHIRGYIHYLRSAYLERERPAVIIRKDFSEKLAALFEIKEIKKSLDTKWPLFKQIAEIPSSIDFAKLYDPKVKANENSDVFWPKIIKAINKEVQETQVEEGSASSPEDYQNLPLFLEPGNLDKNPQQRSIALKLRGYISFIEDTFSLQKKIPREIVGDFTTCLIQLFELKPFIKLQKAQIATLIKPAYIPIDINLVDLYDEKRSNNDNAVYIVDTIMKAIHKKSTIILSSQKNEDNSASFGPAI